MMSTLKRGPLGGLSQPDRRPGSHQGKVWLTSKELGHSLIAAWVCSLYLHKNHQKSEFRSSSWGHFLLEISGLGHDPPGGRTRHLGPKSTDRRKKANS